eukprot:726649_1
MPGFAAGVGRLTGLGLAAFCAIMLSCMFSFWVGGAMMYWHSGQFDTYKFSWGHGPAVDSMQRGAEAGFFTGVGALGTAALGGMFELENDSDHEAVSPGDHSDSEGKDAGEEDPDGVQADVESAALPKDFGWV